MKTPKYYLGDARYKNKKNSKILWTFIDIFLLALVDSLELKIFRSSTKHRKASVIKWNDETKYPNFKWSSNNILFVAIHKKFNKIQRDNKKFVTMIESNKF